MTLRLPGQDAGHLAADPACRKVDFARRTAVRFHLAGFLLEADQFIPFGWIGRKPGAALRAGQAFEHDLSGIAAEYERGPAGRKPSPWGFLRTEKAGVHRFTFHFASLAQMILLALSKRSPSCLDGLDRWGVPYHTPKHRKK